MAHILIVDDEPMVADMFRSLVESKGHRVTVAHDGAAALQAFEADPADVVITDLNMPRMDGNELVARLRERHPALPVMMITGYSGAVSIDTTGTVVLSKPVSLRTLADHLGGLLSACHEPGNA